MSKFDNIPLLILVNNSILTYCAAYNNKNKTVCISKYYCTNIQSYSDLYIEIFCFYCNKRFSTQEKYIKIVDKYSFITI
jgi:hypothetical protein